MITSISFASHEYGNATSERCTTENYTRNAPMRCTGFSPFFSTIVLTSIEYYIQLDLSLVVG